MMETISAKELKSKMETNEEFTLGDAREEQTYKILHIKGAISLPLSAIEKAEELFRKDAKIIVYCGSYECPASDKASKRLVEMGFTNIARYAGGIKEWKELGFPTEEN
ncbi:MAG: rhodanese-like domain-containing protein [Candidatus Bathyarchaeota archaeon]